MTRVVRVTRAGCAEALAAWRRGEVDEVWVIGLGCVAF